METSIWHAPSLVFEEVKASWSRMSCGSTVPFATEDPPIQGTWLSKPRRVSHPVEEFDDSGRRWSSCPRGTQFAGQYGGRWWHTTGARRPGKVMKNSSDMLGNGVAATGFHNIFTTWQSELGNESARPSELAKRSQFLLASLERNGSTNLGSRPTGCILAMVVPASSSMSRTERKQSSSGAKGGLKSVASSDWCSFWLGNLFYHVLYICIY